MVLKEWMKKIRNKMYSKCAFKKVIRQEKKIVGNNLHFDIEKQLLLISHSLEKGMSIPNSKIGFGIKKAEYLILYQKKYISLGFEVSSFAFRESVAVLQKWIDFSKQNGVNVDKIKNESNSIMKLANIADISAGFNVIGMEKVYSKIDKSLVEYFISTKHSVRQYIKKPIPDDIMLNVMKMTAYAPSACNRQPCKIYWTSDMEKVGIISHLIPGNKGFEDEVPNWAFVSVDRRFFNGAEGLQGYVNGGIYLAYFILCLHANAIGSCIFQIPIADKNVPVIKKLAGISDCEAIIAAVGFGYAADTLKFACAQRRPISETLVKF